MPTQRTPSSPTGRSADLAADVAAYLAPLRPDFRAALERLRKAIFAAAPRATEKISYRIPTFAHDGRPLVGMAAFTNHCSFFVMSPAVIEAHAAELAPWATATGTVRFDADAPLPLTLIKKLVKARLAENAAVEAARKARKSARRRSE